MTTQFLTRHIASDAAVLRFTEAGCYLAAGLIPWLAFRKFAELEISKDQLLLGVLATMTIALLFTVLGVMLHCKAVSVQAKKAR